MVSGGICLITGATRGIGLATAKELARLNYHLVIACRDENAASRTTKEITTAVPAAKIDALIADLSSQHAIRRLAYKVHERFSSLDLLIHNAAIVTQERTLTADGIELQLAVNHLAPFLLTHLLLDLLRAGAPSRIVVVASQVERSGRIDFDDLTGASNYSPLSTYSASKLANVSFTYTLAQRLAGTGISVNCLHPGVVRTGLLNTISAIEELNARPNNAITAALRDSAQTIRSGIRRLLPLPAAEDWAITAEEGARTTIFVATDASLAGVTGKYFRECRESETSPQSHDEVLAQRLWNVSEELTGTAP